MRMAKKISWWLSAAFVLSALPAQAEFSVAPTVDANAMVDALIEEGIEIVHVKYEGGAPLWWSYHPFSGAEHQFFDGLGPVGVFQNGPDGMRDGLLMTTGEIGFVGGPNQSLPGNTSTVPGGASYQGATGVLQPDIGPPTGSRPAEPFCHSLFDYDSTINPHDVVKLTIDFRLEEGYDGIELDFVFGSEEYPDYAPGGDAGSAIYPDAFGFFVLSAEKRAAGLTAVEDYINIGRDTDGYNININGHFFSEGQVIKTYGEDGDPEISEYNGLTPRITGATRLEAGTGVHQMVIVICDAGDQWLDSGVFLRAFAGCKEEAGKICEGPTWCGDGIIQEGEQCDDGNHQDGDGCDANCQIEDNGVCRENETGEQECWTTCNNGIVEDWEDCDDPNDPHCVHCRWVPQAADDHFNVLLPDAFPIPIDSLLDNDTAIDPDSFRLPSTETEQGGTLVIDGDTIIYTPAPDATGTDQFTYEVCHPTDPGQCDSAWVVLKLNQPPALTDAETWTAVGFQMVALDITKHFSDPDGHALSLPSIAGEITGGKALSDAHTLVFSADAPEQPAIYPIAITACDTGAPQGCATATWEVIVNDPPILSPLTFDLGAGDFREFALADWYDHYGVIDGTDPSQPTPTGLRDIQVAASPTGPFGPTASVSGGQCSVDPLSGLVRVEGAPVSGESTCYLRACEQLPADDPAICATTTITFGVSACESDQDCSIGSCHPDTGVCAPCPPDTLGNACQASSGPIDLCCSSGQPVCDESGALSVCVECTRDDHCAGDMLCDLGSNTCNPPPTDVCPPVGTSHLCTIDPQSDIDTCCTEEVPVCDPTSNPRSCQVCAPIDRGDGVDRGCDAAAPTCHEDATGTRSCIDCPPGELCCALDIDCPSGRCDRDTQICEPIAPACPPDDSGDLCAVDLSATYDTCCSPAAPVCDPDLNIASCFTCSPHDRGDGVHRGCDDTRPFCHAPSRGLRACIQCPEGENCCGHDDDCPTGQVCAQDAALCVDPGSVRAINDSYKTQQGVSLVAIDTRNLVANDVIPLGESIEVSMVDSTAPDVETEGKVAIEPNGDLVYVPAPTFYGELSFLYLLRTHSGLEDTATVQIRVHARPVANDDEARMPQNEPTDIAVLQNDFDPEGSALTVQGIVSGPAHGDVEILEDGTIRYTPDGDYSGPDSFRYQACNVHGVCDSADVIISVGRDDLPEDALLYASEPDYAKTPEDIPVLIFVMVNDDPDLIPVEIAQRPYHGQARFLTDGVALYSPKANWYGRDLFTYKTCTADNSVCREEYVLVDVFPVNDPPVARQDFVTTSTNTAVFIPVLKNDYDPDGDELTGLEIVSAPNKGQVEIIGVAVEYTPQRGFSGDDVFEYKICDPHGLCAQAKVHIIVGGPAEGHQPPEANDDNAVTRAGELVIIDALANDISPHGDALIPSDLCTPRHGEALFITDGTIRYTPDIHFTGIDSFCYSACDKVGACDTAVVHVTVLPAPNNPPVALDDFATTSRGVPLFVDAIANDFDPDGDPIVLESLGQPSHGQAVIEQGQIYYTPEAAFVGIDRFEVQISDGLGGIATSVAHITVLEAPNAPPEAHDDLRDISRREALSLRALDNDNDPDGDPLTIVWATQAPEGSVRWDESGDLIYDPFGDLRPPLSPERRQPMAVFYGITDGQGGFDDAKVILDLGYDIDDGEVGPRFLVEGGGCNGGPFGLELLALAGLALAQRRRRP